VLPLGSTTSYRGVDRDPFEPKIMDEEIAAQPGASGQIYTLYPAGWRRDAYHLYEDGRVTGAPLDVYLLERPDTAMEISRLVSEHLGPHEVLQCRIWPIGEASSSNDTRTKGFIGFDVAYLGGDHYSAILNGLLLNPHPKLVEGFANLLTDAGLFQTVEIIPRYVREFQRLVPSEADSTFHVYSLIDVVNRHKSQRES